MPPFFRNFADYFVETIKLAHVSDEQIKSRFEIVGIEHVDRLLPKDAASPCISDIAVTGSGAHR